MVKSLFLRIYRKLFWVYDGQQINLKRSKAIPPQTTIYGVSKQMSWRSSMETKDRFLYIIFCKLQNREALITEKLTGGWWRTRFSNPECYQQLKHLQLCEFSSNNTHSFTYLPESVEELFFTEELERNKHQLCVAINFMNDLLETALNGNISPQMSFEMFLFRACADGQFAV